MDKKTEHVKIEATYWVVPVENLISIANPMELDIWDCGVITKSDILSCFEYHNANYSYDNDSGMDTTSREYNIARIAYIADNELYKHHKNEKHPIVVELAEWVRGHPIIDGNHRLAAAHILKEEFITIQICGDLDYAHEILCPVREFEVSNNRSQ